jgi:hypothetical protein
MSAITKLQERRRVLKGIFGGAAISVGLPFLDCFLNESGTALAATGAKLPVCFGTWFWGCGFTPGRWEPGNIGDLGNLGPELKVLEPFKKDMNIFTGFKVHLDGRPSSPHQTGMAAVITGSVPRAGEKQSLPSLDVLVADTIGKRSRFRSLEVAATGIASHSLSRRSASVVNPAETSPSALYLKIFGPEFKHPNSADFKPDPLILARKSVLSAVSEERKQLLSEVGASARARLDEYFTSLRELEQQLEVEIEKPLPMQACTPVERAEGLQASSDIDNVSANHALFASLLAQALACGQTRVVNVVFGDSASSLRRAGKTMTHHILTHEEAIDEKLGYQPEATWFVEQCMKGLHTLLTTMTNIKEGDGTLLDRTLLFIASDTGYARTHSVENMPLLTAGKAGGRIKTGQHVQAKGDPGTRVGLTVQQAVGVPVSSWGKDAMETSKTITEILS